MVTSHSTGWRPGGLGAPTPPSGSDGGARDAVRTTSTIAGGKATFTTEARNGAVRGAGRVQMSGELAAAKVRTSSSPELDQGASFQVRYFSHGSASGKGVLVAAQDIMGFKTDAEKADNPMAVIADDISPAEAREFMSRADFPVQTLENLVGSAVRQFPQVSRAEVGRSAATRDTSSGFGAWAGRPGPTEAPKFHPDSGMSL